MSCDIDYRYRRALQPDGLTTYENALIAVNEAIADAKLAGRKPADCPGVRLLTRHLSRIAEGEETHRPDLDAHLREQCMTGVAELRHTPAIFALVRRGIDHRNEELRHYRREGSRTLRQVANQLGIDHTQYRLGYYAPNESMAGEHVMEASGLYVHISPERFGESGVAWRNPHWKPPGAAMRKAPITVLRDIPAFARRIARELKLSPPAQPGLI